MLELLKEGVGFKTYSSESNIGVIDVFIQQRISPQLENHSLLKPIKWISQSLDEFEVLAT